MTSAVAETLIYGDCTGEFTGDAPGEVIWTAFTTNDTSAPSASSLCNLAGRDFLTFQNLELIGGTNANTIINGSTTNNSQNIVLRDCLLVACQAVSGNALVRITPAVDTPLNWTIERCIFQGGNVQILVDMPTTGGGVDYDVNVQIVNNRFYGSVGPLFITPSGALANKAGGVDLFNNTFIGFSSSGIAISAANHSTTIPSTAYDNILIGAGTSLSANQASTLTEDWNYIQSVTARLNVTAGGNSKVFPNLAPRIEVGQQCFQGRAIRPFTTPSNGSPFLGFGSQAGAPATDGVGRPRPAGGASTSLALGALERHDPGTKETTTTDAGGSALVLVGPGDHDFPVAVNAVSTTISIRARYDSTHAATNKPQSVLVANGEIGVVTETKTMTAAVDTWETLTFSAFTPTAKGFVTIRLVSRAAAGGGKAFFDTAVVPAIDTGDFAHYRSTEPFPAITATGGTGGPVGSGRLTGGLQ